MQIIYSPGCGCATAEGYVSSLVLNVFRVLELGLSKTQKEVLKGFLKDVLLLYQAYSDLNKKMSDLLESFDQVQKVEFTSEEWDLIEHPCQVVFKIQTQEKARNCGCEHTLIGPLRLGKEIIEIQTFPEEGVKRIQKVLTALQVTVTAPKEKPEEQVLIWNHDSDDGEG